MPRGNNITLEHYLNALAIQRNGNLKNINILPFVHTTSFDNFRGMIKEGKVIDKAKSKEKKKVIYFFYGNALYIHHDHDELGDTILIENEPITCLFEIESLEDNFSCFFPFDTGNINRNIDSYTKVVGRDIRGEFKVENVRRDTFKAFIYAFFGDNKKYIDNVPKPTNEVLGDESCIEPYIGIINSLRKILNHIEVVGDHRARTLEITTSENVNLYEVKKVFVPEKSISHLQNYEFLGGRPIENGKTSENIPKTKLVSYMDASYRTYPTKDFYVKMRDKVKDHVEKQLLND
jgi:hypothetical protein